MHLDYKYLLDNLFDGVYIIDRERRIIYWNKAAERLTGFSAEETIGTHCYSDILNHVDMHGKNLCTHGCPLSATMADGQYRELELALRQKNGIRRPISVRTAPLRDESGAITGAIEAFSDNSSKIAVLEKLREAHELTLLDTLTGLFNRRGLEYYLENRFREFETRGWLFGVAMVDVDGFKNINDTYGHPAGDKILKMVSGILRGTSRAYDVAGRWGGEEFLILLAHMNENLLTDITERYRVMTETSCISFEGKKICVSISAGATIVRQRDTSETLIARADDLLYRSKTTGKNKVTIG